MVKKNKSNIHFSLNKINDVKVKKINLPSIDPSKIKGYDMIPELYAQIFLCAHKKSGKTTVLFNILKNKINKDTKVFFFVGTINKDPSYKKITEYLDNKGIEHYDYNSLNIDGENMLKTVIDLMNSEIEEENKSDDDEDEEPTPILIFNDLEDDLSITIKKRKPKKMAPKYLLIFDDISDEIRNNTDLVTLMKRNRHLQSSIIISSQYITDLQPAQRNQIDIWILFKGHNDKKIEDIYQSSDPTINIEDFKRLYHDATKEQFNFFYIDRNNGEYRKNFDHKYEIVKNDI